MIATTKKTSLRKQLLEACTAKLQFTIDDVSDRIKTFVERNKLGDSGAFSNDEYHSEADNNVSEINVLNATLESANHDIALLENLKVTQAIERERALLGAIVVTNHQNFFISSSVGKIIIDGHAYSCISPKSPIYQEMTGMRVGDIFRFRSTTYKIKEIR